MHRRRSWILSLLLPLLLLLPGADAAASNWRALQQLDDVAYFLVQLGNSASVERLQMDATPNGTRLTSIPLSTSPSGPIAFSVDSSGIYVAYPDRIDVVSDTGTATKLASITAGATALYGFGDYLFVVRSATATGTTVQAVKKADGTVGALQTPSTRQGSGFAFDPANGLVYAFATDAGGVRLLEFSLNGSDGTVGTALDVSIPTPSGAARLFPFADGHRVADAGGTVYSATDLLPLDSFGGAVSSLVFRGDVPLVLRGAQLVSFSNTLDQVALTTFSSTDTLISLPSAILLQGDTVWTFSDDNHVDANNKSLVLLAQPVSLTSGDLAATPESGAAIDPTQMRFTPSGVDLDEAGTLYLLDSADFLLFRWDAVTGQFISPIQLTDTPRFLAVSPTNHQVYLGYSAGVVKQIPTGATTGLGPFVDVKAPLCGLVAADALVVTCQKGASSTTTSPTPSPPTVGHHGRGGRGPGGGSSSTLYTSFDATGTQLHQVSAALGSSLVWSSAAGRLYFFASSGATRGTRGAQVVALPLASDGSFGTLVASPSASRRTSFAAPIVPSEDGTSLVLGSGQELDATSLAVLTAALPAPTGAGALVDAATPGGNLWTFRSVGGVAEADRVSGGSVASRALFQGTPLRLFALGDSELVALTDVGGIPTPARWATTSPQLLADTVRFASTSAMPLFDLAAIAYSKAGSSSELSFDTIDMTETGQVSGNGKVEFTLNTTTPEDVGVTLSGSLGGSGSAPDAQLHFVYDGLLNGQPYAGTADMKLTAFDAASNSLTGTQSLNVQVGRQRIKQSGAASWTLPAGVDGSWSLEVKLDPPSGGSITGSAQLLVHPAASASVAPQRSVTVPLSGTFDPTTGHATLSGTAGDASISLDDVTPLARGLEATVGVQWLGQDRSALLDAGPVD